MQLYWRPGTAAFAADAALGEIDVPYERILVERDSAGNVPEDYLRINPMGQVPPDLLLFFMLTEWGSELEPSAWARPNLRAHSERTFELASVRQAVADHRMDLP